MSESPSARAARLLRQHGALVDFVERWIPGANIRRDLFGVADLLAVMDDRILFVQATSASNRAAREQKLLKSPHLPELTKAGVELWLYSCGRSRRLRGLADRWGCLNSDERARPWD